MHFSIKKHFKKELQPHSQTTLSIAIQKNTLTHLHVNQQGKDVLV
jgi:hypothetical protein